MSYLDQPAILQKANEILANNARYLSTASVTPIQHAGVWPGHSIGVYEDGSSAKQRGHQHRSATCSPMRRGRSMSHASADDYYEVMAQASKYRTKSYYGKEGGLPVVHAGAMLPAGLTTAQHRPHYTGSTHSVYGASPLPAPAPGFLGQRADHHASADTLINDTFYQSQMRKLLRDMQQHANDLQRERIEGDKLRQELQERDAAVQDARSVASTAKQHLQEEVSKRRQMESKLADAQRDFDTAHKARLVSEKQLDDMRSLAVKLEQENQELRGRNAQKEAAMRFEAEQKMQQSRQHIESLQSQVQSLQDNLDARTAAFADAERAAKQSSTDAAVLRAQLAVFGPHRLAVKDDSEIELEADIVRLSNMQEQREASGWAGEKARQAAHGASAEVAELRGTLEAKDRDLASMKERAAALQDEVQKAQEFMAANGAEETAALQSVRWEFEAEKQTLQQRAVEAEGAVTLLQEECSALRQDIARLHKLQESTASARCQGGETLGMLNLSNNGPADQRDGLSKALSDAGLGPPVAGTLSVGSVQSWRIEAGGHSQPAAAVEESARLRAALEEAHALRAELEVSSGEHIRALQLQVQELQQQGSYQLQENNSGQYGSSAREEELQRVVQQLQSQLRNIRDIHGVSMPLLDSDEGLLADLSDLSATVEASQTEAAKQLQSEVPQKLESLQGKLEEAEKRSANCKRAQQATADAAHARITELEAQVLSLTEALAANRKKLEDATRSATSGSDELASLSSTIEALRHEHSGLHEQLHRAQTKHGAAQQAADVASRELEAAKLALCQEKEHVGQHMEELADVRMKLDTEERATATAQAAAASARHDAQVARAEVSGLQMEVEGLRGQLEDAEGRYAAVLQESGEGQAAAERKAAEAVSEAMVLQREVAVLKSKLEAAVQDASSAAASAAAAASGDIEGLQGQNTALREEVMDLRLRLEGASTATEEVKQLRKREEKLQHELEDAQQTLSQSQEQAGDSTWVWSQVHDLSAQVATLREQLAQSQASADDLKAQLAVAEAAAAPAKSSETTDLERKLQEEIAELREELTAAQRARNERIDQVSTLEAQVSDLQAALKNEHMRQDAGTRAAAESHARERALEEELQGVRHDLLKAQRSLVAAVESPEDLAGAVSDVAVRALSALRQGVAEALPAAPGVARAAAACNDDWLLQEVAAALSDLQHSSSGTGTSEVVLTLQKDLEITKKQRKKLEDEALEKEVEINQFCDKLDAEIEAREGAEAKCKELQQKLQSATGIQTDLHAQLQRCQEQLDKLKSAPVGVPETPRPRGFIIPELNHAAAASPAETMALKSELQDAKSNAQALEDTVARLEMEMLEVQRQRDAAYNTNATLQQQLKDLRHKGYDLDTKEFVERIAAAEAASAKSKAILEETLAARDNAALLAREEIQQLTQQIKQLERELSQRPQAQQRAPLSMAPYLGVPSKQGNAKPKTPQPRSVVRSDTCSPFPTRAHDPDADSLQTLAMAEGAPPEAARGYARPAAAHNSMLASSTSNHMSTSFGRQNACGPSVQRGDHSDDEDQVHDPNACASIVDIAQETTLADMETFTPVLPADRQAHRSTQKGSEDGDAAMPIIDDPLAHLTPPWPLSSDTSESRPSSHSHGVLPALGPAPVPDCPEDALHGADAKPPTVFTTQTADVPFGAETPSPAASDERRTSLGRASLGGSHGSGGEEVQASLVSDTPPQVQRAVSPIHEDEVMEFADVQALRRQQAAAARSPDLGVSIGLDVDHSMGSLAGFVDFGRMGSRSPVGDISMGGPSPHLIGEPSDTLEGAVCGTPT